MSRIALFACWSVVAMVFVLLQPQLALSQTPLTPKVPPQRRWAGNWMAITPSSIISCSAIRW